MADSSETIELDIHSGVDSGPSGSQSGSQSGAPGYSGMRMECDGGDQPSPDSSSSDSGRPDGAVSVKPEPFRLPEGRNAQEDPESPSSSVTVPVVVPQIDVIVAGPHFHPQFRPASTASGASGLASGLASAMGPVVSSSTSPQRRLLVLPMAPPPPPPPAPPAPPASTSSPLKCVPHSMRMRKSAPHPHEEPSSSIPEIGESNPIFLFVIGFSFDSGCHFRPLPGATSARMRPESKDPLILFLSKSLLFDFFVLELIS